jgi:hypothetical protein
MGYIAILWIARLVIIGASALVPIFSERFSPTLAFGIGMSVMCFLGITLILERHHRRPGPLRSAVDDMDSFPDLPSDTTPFPLDPWDLQQSLMEAAGQVMAERPSITNEALLYYARVLKETAALGDALLATLWTANWSDPTDEKIAALLRQSLVSCVRSMGSVERHIHTSLRTFSGGIHPDMELDLQQAIDLLRAGASIQSAAAGFTLAAGLPGREGYQAMVNSNLSKIDPWTGRIVSDQYGRWKRGKGYQPPMLEQLLVERFPHLDSLVSPPLEKNGDLPAIRF